MPNMTSDSYAMSFLYRDHFEESIKLLPVEKENSLAGRFVAQPV